jgi:hypothetical protein
MCNAINAELLPGRAVRSAARFSFSALMARHRSRLITMVLADGRPLSLKDRLREQHHPTHATAGPYLRNLVLLRRWQPLPLGEGGRKPMSKHQTAASTYSLIKTKRKADFELTKQVLNKVSGGGVYPLGSKSGGVTHGGYREMVLIVQLPET